MLDTPQGISLWNGEVFLGTKVVYIYGSDDPTITVGIALRQETPEAKTFPPTLSMSGHAKAPNGTSISSSTIASPMSLQGKVVILAGGMGPLAISLLEAFSLSGVAGIGILDGLEAGVPAGGSLATAFDGQIVSSQVELDKPLVQEAMTSVVGKLGRIDILIAFTDTGSDSPSHVSSNSGRIVDVNLDSVFFPAQAAAKFMINQGNGGCIIFVSSIIDRVATTELSQRLGSEWARHDIRVHSLNRDSNDPGISAPQVTAQVTELALYLALEAGAPPRSSLDFAMSVL